MDGQMDMFPTVGQRLAQVAWDKDVSSWETRRRVARQRWAEWWTPEQARKALQHGRRTTRLGYTYLRVNSELWMNEHRLVMELKLGRPLRPGENVHHVNGVRTDNRPENLELWVVSQPAGQRPEDLVRWAWEIIARYGGEDDGVSGEGGAQPEDRADA